MQIDPLDSSSAKERIEARIHPQIKDILKQAADLQGCSLSNFIVTAAQEKAHTIIEQHRVLNLKLNKEASQAFAEALFNPPQPNQALRRARERYQQTGDW